MERDPTPEALARQDELRRRFATPRLRVGAVKGYVDGVVEAKTAAMFEPYPGGGTGLPRWTQEELDRAVAAYDKAGWQVMLHAIGDRGIDMALTAFERAARANGTSGRRHRVEHIEVPRLADLPRFKAAGVVASTQAMFPYPNREPPRTSTSRRSARSARAARSRSRRSTTPGAVQAFGSDWPVFTAEVVRGIATARHAHDGRGHAGRGLGAAAAALGRGGAAALHARRGLRRARRGRSAARSRKGAPPTSSCSRRTCSSLPPERIKDTKVLLTVLGGQDSYRAKGF